MSYAAPVPGGPAPRVWAHRGARRQAPENTVAAFTRARALGADGVELDARRTADDVVVVHHDPTARRVGVLAEAPFPVVRAARPDIPTLEEALDACAGVTVNVELKNLPGQRDYDPTERLAALVAATLARRGHRDDALVSSFNLETLDRFRALAPSPTGFLTLRGFDPVVALGLVAERGHHALHPDVRGVDPRRAATLVDAARTAGLAVHVWTVNRRATIVELAAAGVDAVITDVPALALRALGRGAAGLSGPA